MRTSDPVHLAHALDRRLKIGIGVVTGCALLGIAVLRATDLVADRRQALAAGERRAANLALILGGYLRGTFQSADASLRQLALHGRRVGGAGAPAADWTDVLRSARTALTGIGSLSVVDRDGVIRHSTLELLTGQSRHDNYVFQTLARSTGDVLVADTPFRSAVGTGRIMIPLGRRITTEGGAFNGIVVATFLPEELRGFFHQVEVGPAGVVSVFHPRGFVLFREPSETNPIGESTAGNLIFEAAARMGPAGVIRGPIRPGGPSMVTAFQSLEEPPIVVAVSLDENDLLADWRREVTASVVGLGLLGSALAAVVVLLLRQIDARSTAEQALDRARRLEAIGQLTGGVAHDFNNLLTVILGNVDLLKRKGSLAPNAVGRVEQIEGAATRAADLVRQLLTFARRQPLKPRTVDLTEVVRSLEPMLARLVREDVNLKLELASEPCLADVDPALVENAVINLCANARDAMPRGGLLLVEAGTAELDERYARRNPDVSPGRYATLAVSDTGVGIPPDDLAHVFEPFFTTKEPGKGTGLGLSMVYGFVKQSGGHIKVYSETGQGTTVRLYFPEVPGRMSPPAPDRTEPTRGGGETVLLVEDEPGVRELASTMLRSLGYRVLVAADGTQALALATEDARIDLLFTDVVLPAGMNGRQVAEQLTRQRPGLPVLYASGYSEDVIAHNGQLEPGFRLLVKPYDLQALARAVDAALGRDGTPL